MEPSDHAGQRTDDELRRKLEQLDHDDPRGPHEYPNDPHRGESGK